MLEKAPRALGRAMKGLRAGLEKVACEDPAMATALEVRLDSPAFEDGGPLPARFTEDGDGVSPPLHWNQLPLETAALALLVEDADSPTPEPIVHTIAWGLSLNGELPEGGLDREGSGGVTTGKNSYLKRGWLPPDPPTGHGPHRYVFQLFALRKAPDFGDDAPGKGDFLDAIRPHLLASGRMTGIYERT